MAKDANDQPSLYLLPMGDAASDILADIDDHFSSPSTRMQSKEVLSCFRILGVGVGHTTVLKWRSLSSIELFLGYH